MKSAGAPSSPRLSLYRAAGRRAAGQLRKLPTLIDRLQTSKRHFKSAISDLPGLEFREVLDPEEEVATILTVILPDTDVAAKIAAELNSKVVAEAGWHVYNNMEHLLEQRMPTPLSCSFSCPHYAEAGGSMQYGKGMLPRTDDLLARSINISIWRLRRWLGFRLGVTINDDLDVVAERADAFRRVASSYLI